MTLPTAGIFSWWQGCWRSFPASWMCECVCKVRNLSRWWDGYRQDAAMCQSILGCWYVWSQCLRLTKNYISIRVLCEHLVRLNAHLVQRTQWKRMTCCTLLLKGEKPLSLCFQHSLFLYTERESKLSKRTRSGLLPFFLSAWWYFKTSWYQAGVKILFWKLLSIDVEKNWWCWWFI